MPLSLRDAKEIADSLRPNGEAGLAFPIVNVVKALRDAYAMGERAALHSDDDKQQIAGLQAALNESHVRIDELRAVIKNALLR